MDIKKADLVFQSILNSMNIKFTTEYRFCDTRRWRADYYLPDYMTLVEIEGGAWVNGRHTRPYGYENDCEKYNKATLMGFKVIRFTTTMINKRPGYVVGVLREIKGEVDED